MASYGTYYNRSRTPTMGDIVNPRDPRIMGGITTQPVGAPAPGPRDLAAEQAAWDAEARALQPGQYMNRQRPGTEGSVDPRTADPSSGYGPGGVRNPNYRAPNLPGVPPGGGGGGDPNAAPQRRAHTYQGSALAYYGTGDIPDTDDFTWGSHATTGFRTDRPKDERGGYTIKNTSGMVFSHYPPKPSSIPMVLADPKFRRLYPNAKQVGFDKIDYGDGKPVDVLKNADPNSDTAEAWAWMPESESVPDGAGAGLEKWRAAGVLPPDPTAPQDTSVSAEARTAVTRRGYRGASFRDWMPGDRGER